MKTPEQYLKEAEMHYSQISGLTNNWGRMTREAIIVAIKSCILDAETEREQREEGD